MRFPKLYTPVVVAKLHFWTTEFGIWCQNLAAFIFHSPLVFPLWPGSVSCVCVVSFIGGGEIKTLHIPPILSHTKSPHSYWLHQCCFPHFLSYLATTIPPFSTPPSNLSFFSPFAITISTLFRKMRMLSSIGRAFPSNLLFYACQILLSSKMKIQAACICVIKG